MWKMKEKKSVEKRISKIKKNWKREIKNERQRKKYKRRIKGMNAKMANGLEKRMNEWF